MKQLRAVGLLAVLLLALAAPAAAGTTDPFVGVWAGTDVDGSHVRLVIHQNPTGYGLNYFDDWARSCDGDMALVKGTGTLDGGVLSTSNQVWCLQPMRWLTAIDIWYSYDPATDTLWDGWVTWTRVSHY